MINVDDSLIEEYNKPTRDLCAQVLVYTSASTSKAKFTLTNDEIISLNIKSSLSSETSFTLGNIATSQLTFEVYFDEELIEAEESISYLEPYIGIKPEGESSYTMTKLGRFYLDSISSSNNYKTLQFSAYDILSTVTTDTETDELATTLFQLFQLEDYYNILNVAMYIIDALYEVNTSVNPVEFTRTATRTAENIDYDSDGEEVVGKGMDFCYGITKFNAVFLPPDVTSITLTIYTKNNYTNPLKVCYYSDLNCETQNSIRGYTTYSNYTKTETSDGYKITQSVSLPYTITNSIPRYMTFSIEGDKSNSYGSEDTYEIELVYNDRLATMTTDFSYDYDELITHTFRELASYAFGFLGTNLIATNDRTLYPRTSTTGSDYTSTASQYRADVKAMPYTETGFEITPDITYQGEFTQNQYNPVAFSYVTTGTTENPVSYSSTSSDGKFGLNFINSFYSMEANSSIAIQLILAIMLARYTSLTDIMTGSIRYRGNPFVEVGDIIIVKTTDNKKYQFIVMENEIRFSGGMSCTVTSNLETSNDTNRSSDILLSRSTSSITTVINNIYSTLLSKINGTE